MSTRLAAVLCLASAVVSGGCGYTLAGRGSQLPAHIRVVGVPAFTNRANVFNLETILTQRVRAEFIGRGKYRILPQSADVDALLSGEIVSVSVSPVSFNPQQQASRYVITMTVSLQFRDLLENRIIWENPSLVFRQEYEATSGRTVVDPNAFFGQEANALERVSAECARAIVSAILETF